MNRWIVVCSLLVVSATVGAPTEWHSPRAGNPLVPGYFADPCSRKFGDTYYIYATPDGWDVGRGPAGAWTSKDFVHWTWHAMNWPRTEFKWAPSVVERGGKYYLFNSVPCQVWGAVADTPLGPWTNLVAEGKPLIPDQTPKETITLDGECFLDDDGQAYLWYGTWWRPTVARLTADLRGIDGEPIQFFKNPRNPNPPRGTVFGCMEGPYMFKRQGRYYLMYSDNMCQDSSYNVKYSTSASPTGPFTYDPAHNPLLATNDDDTVDGPGHHSLLVDGDRVFIVYHRHDNPHAPGGDFRQTCVDELHFNADGSIEKVEPSHLGVGYLAPSTVRDTDLALGRPVRASSCLDADHRPEYALDDNHGTLWRAASKDYPQWLEVDLGEVRSIRRTQIDFQYPQVVNRYLVEVSDDRAAWRTFADRRANTEPGTMLDRGEASARYVRLTLLGQHSGRADQWAAVWNFHVYDGVDRPNQAPTVDAGPDRQLNFRFPRVLLDATVHDDGLPNGPLKLQWHQLGGPGTVRFDHPERSRTTATFDRPGRYEVALTADDGALRGEGRVVLDFAPPAAAVLAFDFDEPAGRVARDSSGNGQVALLRNQVGHSCGPHGGALHLAGGWASLPALGELRDLTFAAWLNPHHAGDGGLLGSDDDALRLTLAADGAVQFALKGQPTQASSFRFTAERVGEWRHLAVVCERAARRVSFYVDGQLDAARPLAEAPALSLLAPLKLGAANGARNLAGELDEVRVFDQALPAAQVAQLAVRAPFTTVADLAALPDGASVRLVGKPVTLAPANPLTFERASDYFYLAEADGSAGIRVERGSLRGDPARAGTCVSLVGVLRTRAAGERFVDLTAAPTLGAQREARPSAFRSGALGQFTRVEGVVQTVAPDRGSFTLAEPAVEVVLPPPTARKPLVPGFKVAVLGVLGTLDDARPRLLAREVSQLDPPPSVLLARYGFDGAELAKDGSPNQLDARLVGAPVAVDGHGGRALRLDGRGQHLRLPDLGLQPALTVALWLNLASDGRDGFSSSVLHCDGWGFGDLHWMILKENGQLRAAINGVSGDVDSTFAFTPAQRGQWVHLALTVDTQARTLALYVNGRLDKQGGCFSTRPLNLTHARLGAWNDRDRLLDGSLGDVQLYSRALTADEVGRVCRGEVLTR